MVKKFNQALFYAQNDSDDLAVLQLKRIVDEKPNFVKAHLLLALLYMEHGDYVKAGKSPGQGAPDRQQQREGHPVHGVCKEHTGKAEVEKKAEKCVLPTGKCRMMM